MESEQYIQIATELATKLYVTEVKKKSLAQMRNVLTTLNVEKTAFITTFDRRKDMWKII